MTNFPVSVTVKNSGGVSSSTSSVIVTTTSPSGFSTFAVTAPSGSGSSFAGSGTRIIYVSSSTGHDTTGDGTQGNPYASINKGSSFLRAGHDDWLLLKCGDTFTNDKLASSSFSGSGMSVSPSWSTSGSHTVSGVTLFGYYGDQTLGRPIVQISATTMGSNAAYLQVTGANQLNNVAWNGWNFYGFTRDPNNGAFITGDATFNCGAIVCNSSGSNVIFEDNFFSYFGGSFSQSPTTYGVTFLSTFVFRRNVVKYNYLGGGESQGMYLAGISTFCLIEENIFDHNGWLPASFGVANTGPNLFNHNAYFSTYNTNNFIVRGNIFANDAGESEFRPGGVIYNNLFTSSGPTMVAGMGPVTMTYNVIQDAGAPIVGGANNGWGYELGDAIQGSLVDHNIISNENANSFNLGNDFFIQIHGPDGSEYGSPIIGDFVNGSATISNVHTTMAGNNDANTNENWAVGIALHGVNVPANTTVFSRSFSSGNPGTITMSNPAIGTTGNSVAFSKMNLNQTVSNNIAYKQIDSAHTGLIQGIADGGTNTIITNNCYDPSGTNSGQPGEPFPSPTRSIGSYSTSVGGAGTIVDFLTKVASQQKSNWSDDYTARAFNDYLRTGFNFPLQG